MRSTYDDNLDSELASSTARSPELDDETKCELDNEGGGLLRSVFIDFILYCEEIHKIMTFYVLHPVDADCASRHVRPVFHPAHALSWRPTLRANGLRLLAC